MLTWQLILIQLVTFVLIVLFLRWLLYSHISRALKKLHKLNKQNLAKEKALKEELDRAKKQAKGEIIRAKQEAEVSREKIRLQSEEEAAKIIEQAHKEAKKITEDGERESQRRSERLKTRMQEKTAYLALDAIKYVFTQKGQENLQGRLIDELIEELKKTPSEKLNLEKSDLEVISAFEIEKRQQSEIKKIFSSKINKEIFLKNRIDKEIIAGIILKSGGFVVDGSLVNKLKKVFPLIKEKAIKD